MKVSLIIATAALSLAASFVAGAQTYQYEVSVVDNLKTKIEYTVTGRFKVFKDERGSWTCSSEGNVIAWEPGLDSLKVDAYFKDGVMEKGIDLVFGDLADPDVSDAKVIKDMATGVGQMVGGMMKAVKGRTPQSKVEYIPPMKIHLPVSEGNYTFRMGVNEKGLPEISKEKLLELDFSVTANMEKLLSMAAFAPGKILKGDAPYISATAQISLLEENGGGE